MFACWSELLLQLRSPTILLEFLSALVPRNCLHLLQNKYTAERGKKPDCKVVSFWETSVEFDFSVHWMLTLFLKRLMTQREQFDIVTLTTGSTNVSCGNYAYGDLWQANSKLSTCLRTGSKTSWLIIASRFLELSNQQNRQGLYHGRGYEQNSQRRGNHTSSYAYNGPVQTSYLCCAESNFN